VKRDDVPPNEKLMQKKGIWLWVALVISLPVVAILLLVIHGSKVPAIIERPMAELLANQEGYKGAYVETGGYLVSLSGAQPAAKFFLSDKTGASVAKSDSFIELVFDNSPFDWWNHRLLNEASKEPQDSKPCVLIGGVFRGRNSEHSCCQLSCYRVKLVSEADADFQNTQDPAYFESRNGDFDAH
jgi:hypothetical protein